METGQSNSNQGVKNTEVLRDGKIDTYSYRGWLVSDHLLKRAFAVWAYSIVFQIIVGIILLLVFTVLGIGFWNTYRSAEVSPLPSFESMEQIELDPALVL